MSFGYASRLSFREDLGGQLGAPEHEERPESVALKVAQLVELVTKAKHVVVLTGAGVSTSTGIPDFRSPTGVWTLQRLGLTPPPMKTSLFSARPSFTHMAIIALYKMGKVQYLVSQNVDGLHLRSGFPREKLAELHGNCFMEGCPRCGHEYVRDFEMETVGFKPTGRRCTEAGCVGRLRDKILDWEDALPEDELDAAEQHAKKSDLMICLGTSLQITPCCNLPLKTRKAGGAVVIVNLQKTPKDRVAKLKINGRCDDVMRGLMLGLQQTVPRYLRWDRFVIGWRQQKPRPATGKQPQPPVAFALQLCSVHGESCPMPMAESLAISVSPIVDGSHDDALQGSRVVLRQPPFILRHSPLPRGKYRIDVQLTLGAGADADKRTFGTSAFMELLDRAAWMRLRESRTKPMQGAFDDQVELQVLTQDLDYNDQPGLEGGSNAKRARIE